MYDLEKITKILFIFAWVFLIGVVGVAGIVSAETNVCCEKTLSGLFCQNVLESKCVPNSRAVPTSCESTSYCKQGYCFDSVEGTCSTNSPQLLCTNNSGKWFDDPNANIPQCKKGCCILGENANFVTSQQCSKMSERYGLKADFKAEIATEFSCLVLSKSREEGACVFESEFTKTCTFGTRGECNAKSTEESVSNNQFFKDFLCTSEQLNTNCQKSEQTTCLEGKDGVYFVDSCGNPANIYDASKINDKNYWEKVVPKSESCTAGGKNCGNCDYLGGSICAEAERGEKATYGDFICKDVTCYETYDGQDYINGESWCVYDNGKPDDDRVGSRHYRHACFMGEEIVEPCADLRQEVCVEDSIEDFSQAGCVANLWEDCLIQERKNDFSRKRKIASG